MFVWKGFASEPVEKRFPTREAMPPMGLWPGRQATMSFSLLHALFHAHTRHSNVAVHTQKAMRLRFIL